MDEGEVYRDGGDAARGRGGGRPRKCKWFPAKKNLIVCFRFASFSLSLSFHAEMLQTIVFRNET